MSGDNVDVDDAADTLRFSRVSAGATSIYDLTSFETAARHRGKIREARQDVAGLREALTAGWDVGPELAHEERRLAALEAPAR